MGTTATGSVDPLAGDSEVAGEIGFRVHVDGAYGGYLCGVDLEEKTADFL